METIWNVEKIIFSLVMQVTEWEEYIRLVNLGYQKQEPGMDVDDIGSMVVMLQREIALLRDIADDEDVRNGFTQRDVTAWYILRVAGCGLGESEEQARLAGDVLARIAGA